MDNLCHIREFVPFWTGETLRIVRRPAEPWGRDHTDTARLAAVTNTAAHTLDDVVADIREAVRRVRRDAEDAERRGSRRRSDQQEPALGSEAGLVRGRRAAGAPRREAPGADSRGTFAQFNERARTGAREDSHHWWRSGGTLLRLPDGRARKPGTTSASTSAIPKAPPTAGDWCSPTSRLSFVREIAPEVYDSITSRPGRLRRHGDRAPGAARDPGRQHLPSHGADRSPDGAAPSLPRGRRRPRVRPAVRRRDRSLPTPT